MKETSTVQNETPIALVRGEIMTALPRDLYIPPEAMKVLLETFEGPLDLLLYLIKKENIDILDIPVAEVSRQYMEYVDYMKDFLELAADYLVMAALLAEIKSRMLLPQPENNASLEEDPRAELVRRLQEYERFKQAASELDQLPRDGRDHFRVKINQPDCLALKPLPEVQLPELLQAFSALLARAELHLSHSIHRESLSIQERMTHILTSLETKAFLPFTHFFCLAEGKPGVVVAFLAMLELLRNHLIELIQTTPFGMIHVKAKTQ